MPIFKVQSKEKKVARKIEIPQELIDEYKGYIDQLDRNTVGTLEFDKGENIALGRKALQQAGEESKKYVKVRKARGQDAVLQVERITRKEWVEAKKRAKERGAKIKEGAKPEVKVKAKMRKKRS
jgi:hypothetical protein